jgi:hypothetical protein
MRAEGKGQRAKERLEEAGSRKDRSSDIPISRYPDIPMSRCPDPYVEN